jgi:hypothetical protein
VLPSAAYSQQPSMIWIDVEARAKGMCIEWRQCRIALVGACSAARVSEDLAEEMPGLVRGFFLAGVPSVVAASWAVPTPVPRPKQRSAIEVLWDAMLQELVATPERRTVSEAVRRARSLASLSEKHPFVAWGHLGVYGHGGAVIPLSQQLPLIQGTAMRPLGKSVPKG